MTDTDTEIETGTESEIESEFEDDVVAKAACALDPAMGVAPILPLHASVSPVLGVETPVGDVHDLRSSGSVVEVRPSSGRVL
jgi:hypothetical protein